MNAGLSDLMTTGVVALVAGFSALVLLVRNNLAAAGSSGATPPGAGAWFLGAALGLGVIAFSIKLVIIAVVSGLPQRTVAPLVADTLAHWSAPPERADALAGVGGWVADGGKVWQSLPMQAPAPPNNPVTPEKVALGERLFHDPQLSRDGSIACASCHRIWERAGADGKAGAVGITRVAGRRNAPTVWNAAFQSVLFWDGRASSLEEQAMGPLVNPDEMGMPSLADVVARVTADLSYRPAFDRAFGPEAAITIEAIAAAIASYERTLITPDAPYDRFMRGDADALTAEQKRGMWLFQSAGCVRCHSGPNFSSASVFTPRSPFRLFLASRSPLAVRYALADDKGSAPQDSRDGVWRVPSLRNVALTAPYFHSGAVEDLAEAVRVMATAQSNAIISDDPRARNGVVWLPDRHEFSVDNRLVLSSADVDDIVAFLKALTGEALAAKVVLAGQ